MSEQPDPEASGRISWGLRRRLEFIDFRLKWEGRINRKDLVERFQMSPPQATNDLERYAQQAPGNIRYDAVLKTFLREDSFKPRFVAGQADRYLLQLQALRLGWLEKDQTFFDNIPSLDVATIRRRVVPDEIMMTITDAIRRKTRLAIRYWTTSGKPVSTRTVAPHALASGAGRWHMRAWNEEHGDFRDFNLTRIESAEIVDGPAIDPKFDFEWNTVGGLRLRANPILPKEEQAAIRRDYEFDGDELMVHCRLALMFYLLAEFGLDGTKTDPHAQQLVLENRAELEDLRVAARKMSIISLQSEADARD
jgi:hypothetical protein